MRVMLRTADNLISHCRRHVSPDAVTSRVLARTETHIKQSLRDIMALGSVKVKQGFNVSRKKFLEDDVLLTKTQISNMIRDVRLKIKKARGQVA